MCVCVCIYVYIYTYIHETVKTTSTAANSVGVFGAAVSRGIDTDTRSFVRRPLPTMSLLVGV